MNFSIGDLVSFETPDGRSLKGRVRSNPTGKHHLYKVRSFAGESFQVPVVFLEPLSN